MTSQVQHLAERHARVAVTVERHASVTVPARRRTGRSSFVIPLLDRLVAEHGGAQHFAG
jgi:hypothetical protein